MRTGDLIVSVARLFMILSVSADDLLLKLDSYHIGHLHSFPFLTIGYTPRPFFGHILVI